MDGYLSVLGREVDVRVYDTPSNGERVVHLLDKHEGRQDLIHLGMNSQGTQSMSGLVSKPHNYIVSHGSQVRKIDNSLCVSGSTER